MSEPHDSSTMPTTVTVGTRVDRDLHYEIEQFLFDEALILDSRDFQAWPALFTEDANYWMPVRTARFPREASKEFEGRGGAAFFDETQADLRQRVRKLQTGRSWSEVPSSRTRHLVTNVRAFHTDHDNEYAVTSNVHVYRTRGEAYLDQLVGGREDVLRRTDQGLRIAQRKLLLDQTVLMANNISHFI